MIEAGWWKRAIWNPSETASVASVSAGTSRSRANAPRSRPTIRTISAPAASATSGENDSQSMWGPLKWWTTMALWTKVMAWPP